MRRYRTGAERVTRPAWLRGVVSIHFRFSFAWCLVAGLVCTAWRAPAQPEVYGNPDSSTFIRIRRDTDDWTRHFHLGALVGMNIKANFSMSGSAFGITGSDPARGIFDDGYVRRDQTGDAGGYTGYWGYNAASQYNAAAQELSMHATTSFSTVSPTAGNANVDGQPFPGIDVAYGDNLWYWKHARVGWELGFDWLPIKITDDHPISVNANQYTYVYNVGNIVVPGAPYQGGPSGQGEPIIPDGYDPSKTSSQPVGGTVTGTRTLDVSLYALRLGPSFYWDLTDHLGMSLGAGPAVGIVSGNYKYDEIITTDRSSVNNPGQFGGTKFVYGGYVNATLMCHVVDNGDIFVGAQYMPMTDATISGGGREGRLELGGQLYFTVGINWPF
ncbi:MAG TPA: hypothetical protein VMJ12_00540 [Candidatus Acidoferrales bacterium]|nr:hypothetical protein [Candidatus Acidoferrales bacterium]